MTVPQGLPRHREPLGGALAPLAGALLGFIAAAWDVRCPMSPPAPLTPPAPTTAPIAAPDRTTPASAAAPADTTPPPPLPAAAAQGPASYRADMGLTGVFDAPFPTAPVAVRWRVPALGTPAGGLLWNGRHFVVALAEGTVVALAPDGREVWRRGAGLDGIAGPPVFDGRRCFVVSPRGTFAAFEALHGELLWRRDAPVAFAVRSAPVVVGKTLIAVSADDGRLLALDAEQGQVLWITPSSARCDGPPSAMAEAVFFGHCDAEVQWHAVRDGARLGGIKLGDEAQVAGAVAVAGGLAAFGSRAGDLTLLDTRTGTVRWRTPLGGDEVFCAPVLTADIVVGTTAGAEIVALETRTGAIRWRHATDAVSTTSPILVGGRVVVAAAGAVLALDAASGAVLWRIEVGDSTTELCAGAGLIVVGTDAGEIVAIGAR